MTRDEHMSVACDAWANRNNHGDGSLAFLATYTPEAFAAWFVAARRLGWDEGDVLEAIDDVNEIESALSEASVIVAGKTRSYVKGATRLARSLPAFVRSIEHWKQRALVAEASLKRLGPAASSEHAQETTEAEAG
jgi:hypothetical protein